MRYLKMATDEIISIRNNYESRCAEFGHLDDTDLQVIRALQSCITILEATMEQKKYDIMMGGKQ